MASNAKIKKLAFGQRSNPGYSQEYSV
jgi:hypothetical protein